MEKTVENGRTILVFDDAEELKWHYHRLLCHGQITAEFYMNRCVTEKNVNEWLKRLGEPYRVKETEK